MKLDICSLGNAIVDVQFNIKEEFVSELQNRSIHKGSMTLIEQRDQEDLIELLRHKYEEPILACGGSVTNSIMAATSFGSRCHVACKVSNDDQGSFFLRDLTKNKIHHSVIASKSHLSTGRCVVMVSEDAERTMCTYLGISNELAEDDIDTEAINASKYLFVEGYLVTSPSALKACYTAIKEAKKSNTKVAISLSAAFIAENFKAELNSLINLGCDLLLCNESEALTYTDCTNLVEAEKNLRNISFLNLITIGKKGCLAWDGSNLEHIRGFQANAIDTNGAGDMFAGAVLHQLCQNKSLKYASKFGCFAASKKVENFGPRLSQEEYKNIKLKFLK